jgi:hypothetical protein
MDKEMEKLSITPSPSYNSTEVEAEEKEGGQRLPNEILDHIWLATIACTGPRIVDIRCESKMDGLTSSCKIPPLLHTCSRARALALTRWPLCFPSQNQAGNTAAKIFFDYTSDTLFFTQEFVDIVHFSQIVSKAECLLIRSVAFDLRVLSSMFLGAKFARTVIQEFEKDVRVAFVVREGKGEERVWDRGGKMVQLFPVRDPSVVWHGSSEGMEVRFIVDYGRERTAPSPGFVGVRVVGEEEGEAWDLRSVQVEKVGDPGWKLAPWKHGWRVWFEQQSRESYGSKRRERNIDYPGGI